MPIIGGMFALPAVLDLHAASAPPFCSEKSLLLANARCGLALLVERLSPAQVWLPSYLCAAVLKALWGRGTQVRFYPLDGAFGLASLDWLAALRPGDLLVLIDHFGFSGDLACVREAKARGAWVLEDACQALLSVGVGQCADFVLYSPRKFLGVPDGGVLVSNCEVDFSDVKLASPPSLWYLQAVLAAVQRREFDRYGGRRDWFELYQVVEREQPVGHYAMSELSCNLLWHAFDYAAIAQHRVDNYNRLAVQLGDVALFAELGPGVVPLGFAIRVPERDRIRQKLFANQIYPPVHWPLEGVVPARFQDSQRLSAQVMTLPCDQRYGAVEMDKMARLLRQALDV